MANTLKIIAAPAALPISLDLARLQVKQDITADDLLLRTAILSAALAAESEIERTLLVTRFAYVLDGFPGGSGGFCQQPIDLPRSPLIQVVGVQYLDQNGAWQTMPATDYVVVDGDPIVRIAPVFGRIWPIPRPQPGNVKVIFEAGYASGLTVDVAGNWLTPERWSSLSVGDVVRFSNSGGALPSPLQPMVEYYVQAVSGTAIRVAATAGGAAITLADGGTGLHYLGRIPDGIVSWMLLRIDSLYQHRGETSVVQGKLERMPYADLLLDPYRAAYQ